MNETPKTRCTHCARGVRTHFAKGVRCEADATHRLLDDNGDRAPGCVMCKEHARAVITEYRDKMGWAWTMEPLDAQAERIAELEAAAREIIAAFPNMRDIPGCTCEKCQAAHALIALLPKEATDDEATDAG